ncbi:MAG: PspC domain-containing protein [Bacteroidaceae bacterium]|nr:PspC domain-containing protein [Bacteroidaceae bacterium]
MKKNITINLCGRLFAIDEDAYEMLSTYEQSLRNYFRSREGGEEIADDIETRIAELLDEVKQGGTEAITIEHVREIIHRIGRPEEMEGAAADQPTPDTPSPDPSPVGEGSNHNSSAEDAASQTHSTPRPTREGQGGGSSTKRLYRNPDDKKLMGVLSGFAAYFGGDVLWWRMGYAALVLLSFAGSNYNFLWFLPGQHLYFHIYFWGISLIIAYILLAVLMPVAETPEDRLRMKGKEVNPQNLAEEITKSGQPTPDPSLGRGDQTVGGQAATNTPPQGGVGGGLSGNPAGHRGHSGCIASTFGCIGGFFVALWTVITTLFRWCIYAFGAFIAVMCLVGIVCLTAFAVNPYELLQKGDSFFQTPEFAALVPELHVPFYVFVVAIGLVLAITAYAIIHSLLNEFRQMPSMPYRQRIALLLMWIAGLVVAGASVGYGLPKLIKASEDYHSKQYTEWIDENTHDGIFVNPHEWKWLRENGWRILNGEGCNARFTTTGEYMTGDRNVRYLDCYDEFHRQRYRAEHTETLQPGTYRLTCAARANGTGACIYAIVGDEPPIFKEIPATGNTGGSIHEEAKKEMARLVHEADSLGIEAEIPERIRRVVKLNGDIGGFGWNRITIEPIRITKPTLIRYGLTSDDAFTGRTWLGQWFSATDFEVSLNSKQ